MELVELFKQYTGRNGFYNIMPIANLKSVMEYGLLSNARAVNIEHCSVAMQEIQEKRDLVEVPNGKLLHRYANLYFDPRNPMMYKRRFEDICIVRIKPEILNTPGAVVADQNASSKYVKFSEPAEGLKLLDYRMVYAKDWRDEDQFTYMKKKSHKCAELLIPDRVPPEFIDAIAVKNTQDQDRVKMLVHSNIVICLQPHLFFID